MRDLFCGKFFYATSATPLISPTVKLCCHFLRFPVSAFQTYKSNCRPGPPYILVTYPMPSLARNFGRPNQNTGTQPMSYVGTLGRDFINNCSYSDTVIVYLLYIFVNTQIYCILTYRIFVLSTLENIFT